MTTRLHRTSAGGIMRIEDMEDSHLLATIRLLKKKAAAGVVVRYGGGSTAEDIWYDEDHLHGADAWGYLNLDAYIAVAKRRGLETC